MASSPFDSLNSDASSALEQPVTSPSFTFTVGSLLNDLNNIQEIANAFNHGWVGSDPLFSHVYFFQPAIRNGNYIPRNLVKKVDLPINKLSIEHYPLKGREISYVKGSNTSNLKVTFYDNQQMQATAYINSWLSTIHTPGGGYTALPSNYKFMMIFLHNQSFGNPITTLTNKLAYAVLPNNLLNTIEFAGITVMVGTYPINSPPFSYENLKMDSACEFTIEFNVDAMFQFPLSLDLSSIADILGLSADGLDGSSFLNTNLF